MTNSETITIFDEIVNCGILEEDSVVVFGAGHDDGKFLETLLEYNGSFEKGRITAIDVDSKKIKSLSRKFYNEEINSPDSLWRLISSMRTKNGCL